MIVALDADYRNDTAQAAAVVFSDWRDATEANIYTAITEHVAPYEAGSFYKREMPCLLNVLQLVQEPIDTIVIDGFVWLDDQEKKGLGAHLYEHFEKRIPVIGVAKSNFIGAHAAARIARGTSAQELFVTAAGMPAQLAAAYILSMHGHHRIPTLLRLADHRCREWPGDGEMAD